MSREHWLNVAMFVVGVLATIATQRFLDWRERRRKWRSAFDPRLTGRK